MKITLNLEFSLIGLDGKPLEAETKAGSALAVALSSQAKGESLKLWQWALDFHQGKPVELDLSDYHQLYDFVEKTESLTILAKAQILTMMISAREKVLTSK